MLKPDKARGKEAVLVLAKGPANAPVTLIEYTDLQCPFCRRQAPILEQLLQAYGDRIRLVIKDSPLNIHPKSMPAHEALMAAAEQDKLWEMHDLLFANQGHVEKADLLGYAAELRLDIPRFHDRLDTHYFQPRIESELAEAASAGVDATPTFFVNGKKVVGFQSLERLQARVDQALDPSKPELSPAVQAARPKDFSIVGAPALGPSDARIKIIEFSDFECPFCAQAAPILHQLLQEYPGQIQWVFKHFPLDSHADSPLAHQAALVAGQQGEFWEMHDLIFAHQPTIKRNDLIGFAQQLGLDVERFTRDLDSGRFKGAISADTSQGELLEVAATPTFFIGGKQYSGALPLATWKQIIAQEMGSQPPQTLAATSKAHPECPAWPFSQGPKDAPLTVNWFSDLESPLSPQAYQLTQQLLAIYGNKMRLVFRSFPLASHPDALLIHEALATAGCGGKFWEMQKAVLERHGQITTAQLEQKAGQVGIDTARFSAQLKQRTYASLVQEDLLEAQRNGVLGSPVFLINEVRVEGLRPLAELQRTADEQLSKRRASTKSNP